MEKTTKKSKAKKKGLKKRIGLIAMGGLSLVLTVCLSVGATLAWFAGSTWSSQTLYMGGPVYVEMSGANNSLYATLAEKYKDIDIIASGGISSLEDIKAVARAGATSVVLGRSLLENKFTVEEAVLCWQNA